MNSATLIWFSSESPSALNCELSSTLRVASLARSTMRLSLLKFSMSRSTSFSSLPMISRREWMKSAVSSEMRRLSAMASLL